MANRQKQLIVRIFLAVAVIVAVGMGFGDLKLQAAQTAQTAPLSENICYTNPSTGYRVIIIDEQELLTGEDKASLVESMEPVTQYGEAVYKVTTSSGTYKPKKYMEIQYGALVSAQSGVLVLFDRRTDTISMIGGGKMEKQIGYWSSVSSPRQAFEQVYARMEQARRALPMKYACNAMLALIIAMLINFVLVDRLSQMQKTSEQELMDNVIGYSRHGEVLIEFLTRTETYHPRSKR